MQNAASCLFPHKRPVNAYTNYQPTCPTQSQYKYRKRKKAQLFSWAFIFGSPTWARTRDLRINSPSLYRLSYQGIGKYYRVTLATRQALSANKSQIIAICFNLHHICRGNCFIHRNFWHISTAQACNFSRHIRVWLYQIGTGLHPLQIT